MRIKICAYTDQGSWRDRNEDAVWFRTLGSGETCCALGMVCDGIGGLEHGEEASRGLADCARRWMEALSEWLNPAAAEPEILSAHFRDAAENWNEEIFEYCSDRNIVSGTTLSALLTVQDQYCLIHCGDSRIYRIQQGGPIVQLTTDESISAMRDGRLKKYLDNYVGKQPVLRYQTMEGALEKGEMFLLCSDGFSNRLQEEDLWELFAAGVDRCESEKTCRDIIVRLRERGEKDNISLMLMRVG